jgi:hypothetical protein
MATRKELTNGKYIDDQMGNGVPEGGTTGQVLRKSSNADYDVEWGVGITQQGGGGTGTVTAVTASSPLASSGGAAPNITIQQASSSLNGYLSSGDWNIFNGKYNLPSLTAGSVLFSNGTTIAQDNANFFWDNSTKRLGIGTASPQYKLDVSGTFHTTGQNTLGDLSFTGSTNKVVTATSAGLLVNDDIVTNFAKYGDILTQPNFAGRTLFVSPAAMNAALFSIGFGSTTQAQWTITDTSLGGALNAKTRRYQWKNRYNTVATFTGSTSGTTLTTTGNPALFAGCWIRLTDGTETGLGQVVSGSGNTWTLSVSTTQASQTMKAIYGSRNVYSQGNMYFGFWNAGSPGSITATFKVENPTTGTITTSATTSTGTNITVSTIFHYWKVPMPIANYVTDIEVSFNDNGTNYINYQTQEMVINYAEGIDVIPFINKDGGKMFGTLSFVNNPDGLAASTKGSITNAGALTMATGTFTALPSSSSNTEMVSINSTTGVLSKQTIFSGAMTAAVTADVIAGAINAGQTVASGTTFQQFVDLLLTKIFFPTLNAPSFSLSNNQGNPEIGTTVSVLLTFNFNRGSILGSTSGTWNPSTFQNFRAGASSSYTINGTTQGGNTLTVSRVVAASNSYSGTVTYDTGPQPLDSKGNNYSTPLAGATSASQSTSFTGIYPYYWYKSSSPITAANMQSAIASGAATKVVGDSTGTITINFAATGQYLAVAYPATSTTKTVWYVNALDNGSIPGGVFGSATTLACTSSSGFWSSINYKIHVTAGLITQSNDMELRNS